MTTPSSREARARALAGVLCAELLAGYTDSEDGQQTLDRLLPRILTALEAERTAALEEARALTASSPPGGSAHDPLLTYMTTESKVERAAAYLRIHAGHIRNGTAEDIPNTVAATLEMIATQIEQAATTDTKPALAIDHEALVKELEDACVEARAGLYGKVLSMKPCGTCYRCRAAAALRATPERT